MEDINRATFSTAPASSDCMIFVINLCYRVNKFCVSTFSLGNTIRSSHWFNDYHGHGPLIYNVAYANEVFYCAFHTFERRVPITQHYTMETTSLSAVFKRPGSELKIFISGQSDSDHEQVEVENLNNMILFYSLHNGISLPAAGEASKLANTIHSISFRCCTSRGGKGGTH
ncbi:hypothetical protein ACOSQ2_032340 [Xanthoceras sorbifolium]